MKTIASVLAATMLLVSPVAVPGSALAGLAAGKLSEAVPQGEHSATQDVRHRRRLRHERRQIRRCIRRGHCVLVWVWVPVWYYY